MVMRVAGVLVLAFPSTDYRPPWEPEMLARAAAEFRPGIVPLTDGHPDADGTAARVGELTRLYRSGEGLRFEATIDDDEMVERLAAEHELPVSAEYETRTPWLPAPAWRTVERSEGQGDDYPLVAVAILRQGEEPARRGSFAWRLDDGDDEPQRATLSRHWTPDRGELVRHYRVHWNFRDPEVRR